MEAKIWNTQGWVTETDPGALSWIFNALLVQCGLNILGFQEHHFEPQGWTGLWLLAESHFAIHTFPEHGKAYIELSSCNEGKSVQFEQDVEVLGIGFTSCDKMPPRHGLCQQVPKQQGGK